MNSTALKVACIVPIKCLRTAKSRLAPLLGEAERLNLVLEMLEHALDVLSAVPGIQRVLVVSPDGQVREAAAGRGVDFLLEPDAPGLNSSLERARAETRCGGAQALLILPGDLPLLTQADVELALQPGRGGANLVLAADKANRGTNALFTFPIFDLPFCFGEESLGRHVLAGSRLGADVTILRTPGLGMDVDTPADFLEVAALIPGWPSSSTSA